MVFMKRATGDENGSETHYPVDTIDFIDNKGVKGDDIRVSGHTHDTVELVP